MKVAIVHYWLVGMRGGEMVLESLCEMFPDAVIYTHVYVPEKMSKVINRHQVNTTFIQKLPFVKTQYQKYLPLMPAALTELDLTEYDLVISSESGPAKGVVTNPSSVHVCYIHSPMRYVWDQYHVYKEQAGWFGQIFLRLFTEHLRGWDVRSANGVDLFVANSNYISKRVMKCFRRTSVVVHPPVRLDSFEVLELNDVEDYYLWVGELAPYKRADMIVDAFNENQKKLIVIGDGQCRKNLMSRSCDNIVFLGRVDDKTVRNYMSRCKALVFPGVEDFGIVPVEAIASGRPVIAFADGGVLDTIHDGKNGILYCSNTVDGLNNAISRYENSVVSKLQPREISGYARIFNEERFKLRFLEEIRPLLENKTETQALELVK